ncbi:MAG: thioesterase family protein [Acidimicrobiales bacterium]|nr:thioesterase family protein [Acidimicrobiales bacterium]
MRADEFLGLEVVDDDPCHTVFELVPHLARLDGALYGGSALAASLEAFETATVRPALWGTTQFIGQAPIGSRIEQRVEILAEGRNVCQVRLTATRDRELLYTALGATARPRTGPTGELTGTGATMPTVPPPEQGVMREHHLEAAEFGYHLISEFRRVDYPPDPATGGEPPGHVAIWARLDGETHNTAASLAFLGDMVPLAVAHATGEYGAGTSLDNTLRVGHLVETEWVLLDIEGSTAHDGYGHGHAHLWSMDGTLLATSSQSSPLLVFPRA